MVLANQNAKLTGPDQGFLVPRLVLIRKPWERGWSIVYHPIPEFLHHLNYAGAVYDFILIYLAFLLW
jgi:hypothetical protein